MENKIPTAEEFIEETYSFIPFELDQITELMQEFAKLHVQKALKRASVLAELKDIGIDDETGVGESNIVVDKQSILNAYPLDNIK